MNRFKKVCGSVILAASLVIGLASANPVPAKAAASDSDLAELLTLIETAKAATAKVATENTTKSDSELNVSVSLGGLPVASIPVKLTTTVDPVSKCASMIGSAELPDLSAVALLSADLGAALKKLNLQAGTTEIKAYGDLAKKCVYLYNSKAGRSEVADLPAGIAGGTILDNIDATAFAKLAPYLTITKDKANVTLNLKADEAGVKDAKKDINALLKAFTSSIGDNATVKNAMDKVMKKLEIKGVDFTIKFGVDPTTGVLVSHNIDATIDVSVDGAALALVIKNSTASSVTSDTVAIPEAFSKDAQLIANYPVAQGGLTFTSTLSGKKTIFTVTGVKNAKTITIPATISKLGAKYNVSAAAKNVFKKATKLKTLVIKNGALKKAVKKSPAKYGLSKKVKIK